MNLRLTDKEWNLIQRALRNVGVYQCDTDKEEALVRKLLKLKRQHEQQQQKEPPQGAEQLPQQTEAGIH